MEMIHKYLYTERKVAYSAKTKWTYSRITEPWYTKEQMATPKAEELVKKYLKARQQRLFPIWA